MTRLIGCTAALCLAMAMMIGCGGVTSTGTLAYISNSKGTGFTVYTVNTDGTLTKSSISPQSAPAAPKVLKFSANGSWAYFLDAGGTTLYAYTRAGNGTLATNIACVNQTTTTNCGGYPLLTNGASSLVVSPNSQFIYVALPNTNELAIYSIDQSTGVPSQVGSNVQVGYPISQLVISSGGTLLFGLSPTKQAVLGFTVNTSSGVLTALPTPQSVGTNPSYMVMSTNGSYLYVVDAAGGTATTANCTTTTPCTTASGTTVTTGSITTYSPEVYGFTVGSTGALTSNGSYLANADVNGTIPTNPVGAAITSDNRFLYVANQGTHNVTAYKVSTTAGSLGTLTEVLGTTTTTNGVTTTTASPFDCGTGCTTPSFLAVPAANNALYVLDTAAGKVFQFQINQNTGQLRVNNPTSVLAESTTSQPTWITIR